MDWNALLPQLLGPLGTLFLALLIIWTGVKRIWLFLWAHDLIVKGKDDRIADLTRDRDEWREIARAGASVARQVVTAVADQRGTTT